NSNNNILYEGAKEVKRFILDNPDILITQGEGRWRRVARFRLENEVREGRYWESEEERECRLCGSE
ncbi:hypothetical protein ALC57_16363, partial [Trachymyrmex cornetzi]